MRFTTKTPKKLQRYLQGKKLQPNSLWEYIKSKLKYMKNKLIKLLGGYTSKEYLEFKLKYVDENLEKMLKDDFKIDQLKKEIKKLKLGKK